MNEYLEIVLKKQFEIAGHLNEFDTIDFYDKDTTWYSDFTWTKEQEQEYKTWVIDYLKNSFEARKELMKFPRRKSKEHLETWFMWWNLMYGFKLENND